MVETPDQIGPTFEKAFEIPLPVLIGIRVDYRDNHKLFEKVHEHLLNQAEPLTYALKPGDATLIHAVTGDVGFLRRNCVGARVLATVSTDEKAELARQQVRTKSSSIICALANDGSYAGEVFQATDYPPRTP